MAQEHSQNYIYKHGCDRFPLNSQELVHPNVSQKYRTPIFLFPCCSRRVANISHQGLRLCGLRRSLKVNGDDST